MKTIVVVFIILLRIIH